MVISGTDELPLPSGFEKLDDIVHAHEQDERKRAALGHARVRLKARASAALSPLVALRLERGLSQRALADLIGTSQSHIARIEAGGEDVRMTTLIKLASELRIPVGKIAELIARERDPIPLT